MSQKIIILFMQQLNKKRKAKCVILLKKDSLC